MGTAPREKWGLQAGDCLLTDSAAEIKTTAMQIVEKVKRWGKSLPVLQATAIDLENLAGCKTM